MSKIAFVVMSGDLLHAGHLNILKTARQYGKVVVALATDELNANHKQPTFMDYAQRKTLIENIKGVQRVIPQTSLDLTENLRAVRPDVVVHGDDWKSGRLRTVRRRVIEVIAAWGGELVEPPYMKGISSTALREELTSHYKFPAQRIHAFRRLWQEKSGMQIVGVYDEISAVIAALAEIEVNGRPHAFDAICLSHEANQTDGRSVKKHTDPTTQFLTINKILDRTNKPLLVDLRLPDPDGLRTAIDSYNRIGVCAVILNAGNNLHNSFSPTEKIYPFLSSISASAPLSSLTLIYALSVSDPLALEQVQELKSCGVDGFFIEPEGDYPFFSRFCAAYSTLPRPVPLLVEPGNGLELTATRKKYPQLKFIHVYPHRLQSAAYFAVREEARLILQNGNDSAANEVGYENHAFDWTSDG